MAEPQSTIPAGAEPASTPHVEVETKVIEPKNDAKSDAPVEEAKVETPVAKSEELTSASESKLESKTVKLAEKPDLAATTDVVPEPESAAPPIAPPIIIPQVAIPIVAPGDEVDDADGNDSAYGDDASVTHSSSSITSSILAYRKENGRTYHAYKDGQYMFPNDEKEQDRLDMLHHMYVLALEGKLFLAPIAKEQTLHRVLDIGTGTGIWAIDFADEHPESEVLGVDLSPIQPGYVPPNLFFMIDDVESLWTFKDKFDFIYLRGMVGSLNDVQKFCHQAFENTVPGGWLEMYDAVLPPKLNDGEWSKDNAHLQWASYISEACAKIGRRMDCATLYKEQMLAAGYINVVETRLAWPTSQWPRDRKMKELGMWQQEHLLTGLDSMSYALFCRVLGWSPMELEVFLAYVRNAIRDRSVHSYYEVLVVTGQKPK